MHPFVTLPLRACLTRSFLKIKRSGSYVAVTIAASNVGHGHDKYIFMLKLWYNPDRSLREHADHVWSQALDGNPPATLYTQTQLRLVASGQGRDLAGGPFSVWPFVAPSEMRGVASVDGRRLRGHLLHAEVDVVNDCDIDMGLDASLITGRLPHFMLSTHIPIDRVSGSVHGDVVSRGSVDPKTITSVRASCLVGTLRADVLCECAISDAHIRSLHSEALASPHELLPDMLARASFGDFSAKSACSVDALPDVCMLFAPVVDKDATFDADRVSSGTVREFEPHSILSNRISSVHGRVICGFLSGECIADRTIDRGSLDSNTRGVRVAGGSLDLAPRVSSDTLFCATSNVNELEARAFRCDMLSTPGIRVSGNCIIPTVVCAFAKSARFRMVNRATTRHLVAENFKPRTMSSIEANSTNMAMECIACSELYADRLRVTNAHAVSVQCKSSLASAIAFASTCLSRGKTSTGTASTVTLDAKRCRVHELQARTAVFDRVRFRGHVRACAVRSSSVVCDQAECALSIGVDTMSCRKSACKTVRVLSELHGAVASFQNMRGSEVLARNAQARNVGTMGLGCRKADSGTTRVLGHANVSGMVISNNISAEDAIVNACQTSSLTSERVNAGDLNVHDARSDATSHSCATSSVACGSISSESAVIERMTVAGGTATSTAIVEKFDCDAGRFDHVSCAALRASRVTFNGNMVARNKGSASLLKCRRATALNSFTRMDDLLRIYTSTEELAQIFHTGL